MEHLERSVARNNYYVFVMNQIRQPKRFCKQGDQIGRFLPIGQMFTLCVNRNERRMPIWNFTTVTYYAQLFTK
jgi:hypothetical protein